MKNFFFYFSIVGLVISLLVHTLSIFQVDVMSTIPFIWLLHLGIFIGFIPAIFRVRRKQEFQQWQSSGILNRMNPIKMYKATFSQLPSWMLAIIALSFIYTGINFLIFMQNQTGMPDIINGQYVLQNHGKIAQLLTENEYHIQKARELRGISGHWIFFYLVSAAMLYPGKPLPTQATHQEA